MHETAPYPAHRSLLTVNQAASQLNISRRHFLNMVDRHRVPVVRLGRAVRFRQEDIRGLVEELLVPATDRQTSRRSWKRLSIGEGAKGGESRRPRHPKNRIQIH
jgi:excisionase family DNA binding protein